METALRVTIDIFCSQVVLLLFAGVQNKRDRKNLDYRLFVGMTILVCFALVADMSMLLTNGSPNRLGQAVLRNSAFLLGTSSPFIPLIYALYVEFTTLPAHRRDRRVLFFYFIPAAVFLSASFASLFTSLLFNFDDRGYLRPGKFIAFTAVVFYGYLAWGVMTAYLRRKTISPREFQRVVSFPVPMAFCGVLQIFLPEYPIVLPSLSLSLIVLSATIQERRLMHDYLTGAYNRRRLDEYLEAVIQDCRESGKKFSAFLADVNKFKGINDKYGHVAGDEALVAVVSLIKSGLRYDDFLARYAGDEFVAVLPNTDAAELETVIDRVHARFREADSGGRPYPLSISIGGAVFDPLFEGDAEAFIHHLDTLMYEQKRRFHEAAG